VAHKMLSTFTKNEKGARVESTSSPTGRRSIGMGLKSHFSSAQPMHSVSTGRPIHPGRSCTAILQSLLRVRKLASLVRYCEPTYYAR